MGGSALGCAGVILRDLNWKYFAIYTYVMSFGTICNDFIRGFQGEFMTPRRCMRRSLFPSLPAPIPSPSR